MKEKLTLKDIANNYLTHIESKNGITLIALTVTIVVLLILAGISISMLGGENGIISQSQNAKEKTEIADEKEKISLATIAALGKNGWGEITEENLAEELTKNIGERNIKYELEKDGENFIVTYIDSNRSYLVDNNGQIEDYEIYIDNTPGKLDGEGTNENPYKIESIEDLVALSIMTNGGDSTLELEHKDFTNEYIILSRNLNFFNKSSYCDPNTTIYNNYLGESDLNKTLKEVLTTTQGFNPIGNFYGSYNGNNNIIDNIYIKVDESKDYGFISNANNEIKNLTISGNIEQTNSNIKNIKIGGFVANMSGGEIINCTNKINININGSDMLVGGMVGKIINGKMQSCVNEAKLIYDNTGNVGGLVGTLNTTTIKDCKNLGDVTGKKKTGGIAGCSESNNEVIKCSNNGNITGGEGTGGILGAQYGLSQINSCYNTGKISGTQRVGGLCGYDWEEMGQKELLFDCYNTGEVSGEMYIGGIVGFCNDIQLRHCYNTGTITGQHSVGGICGILLWGQSYYNIGIIEGCYNIGNVKSEMEYINNIEIVGWLKNGTLKNCYFYKNNTIYGYTEYNHIDSAQNYPTKEIITNYTKQNSIESDIYSEDFLTNTLGFGKFISEEDLKINIHNLWRFNENNNPKLWWE